MLILNTEEYTDTQTELHYKIVAKLRILLTCKFIENSARAEFRCTDCHHTLTQTLTLTQTHIHSILYVIRIVYR